MYLVGMVPAGVMADRLGPWLVLVIMLFGLALGSVATGIAGMLVTGAPIVATLILSAAMVGTALTYYLAGGLLWFGVKQHKEEAGRP